jgi:hypothetical protein
VEKKQGLNGSKASYLIQIAKMGQSMVGQKRVSSLGGFFGGESWRAFETQYLPDIKSKESYLLGGYNPKIEKEEDAVSTGFDFNHARVMERMNNAFVSTRTEKDAFQDDPWNNFHEMIDPDNNDHLDTSDVVISLDFVTDEVDPEFNDTNFYAVTLQIDIDGLLNEINN